MAKCNIEFPSNRAEKSTVGRFFWKILIPGELSLGYKRNSTKLPGHWFARTYAGEKKYRTEKLALADDLHEPNGVSILSFKQAKERAEKDTAPVRSAVTTVRSAVEKFIEHSRAEGKKSISTMEGRATKQIYPYPIADLKVVKLKTADIEDWHKALASSPARYRGKAGQEGKVRPSSERARRATANKARTLLVAALNLAFRLDRDEGISDVAWRKSKPFKKVKRTEPPRILDEGKGEVTRLLNASRADADFHKLLRAGIETGARYGELAALRVRHYRNGRLSLSGSKTDRPRTVSLTEDGRAFFDALIVGKTDNDLILTRGGLPWKKSDQNRPMLRACEAAKIKPAINFGNATRHTFGSNAVMSGMSLAALAKHFGHTSTRMVEQHYVHLVPSHVDEQVAAFALRLGPVEPSNVR